MRKKIRVAILFGGKSAEHEVSLQSAKNIIDAIDKEKYDVVLVGIDKQGRWLLNDKSTYLLNADNPKLISLNKSNRELAVLPGSEEKQLVTLTHEESIGTVDVVFPVLHGTYGEDGTMQGMLKMMDIPFVGAGVLGSAVGMDKDVMKRLLRDVGIPVAKFVTFTRNVTMDFQKVEKELGLPLFVKPANLGSSVGVYKVHMKDEFEKAVKNAFQYDSKILIEQYIEGREIEVSVLGNENPIVSVPGEIIPQHEFYSYEAKYIDEKGALLKVPADVSPDIVKEIQNLAIKTFKTLCCEGMARVDCFLTRDNKIFINEINTIPGFTKISMYPRLWEASGISYAELIDRLIQLAIERHKRDRQLKTSFF